MSNTRITVILSFEPKEDKGTLHSTVENHAEVYNWANSITNQYIGARFNVHVLECFSGENAIWDDERERSHS